MKVSHKVVLIASTIVVVTFSVFSWLQYNSVKTALHDKASSSVAETSKVISTQISDWLNGKLALIDMVANTIDSDYSEKNIQKAFDNSILAENFILMFGGLHTDGKAITNDPSWNPTGWDARKRPWYSVARNSRRAALTEPYEDASTKEVLISAVANLTDKGKFLGAFGGDLSLKVIADAINKVNFNKTGYAFLISADGKIISHPDASLNGQSLRTLFPQKRPTTNSQFQEIEVNGQMMFTAFQPLEGLKGTQWLIGVMLEKDKVLKEANAFGLAAIIGTILSVLLTALALFITMKSLFQPLERLQQSLVDINSGDGDLTKRLVATSGDEFGKVSTDFNEFVDYLQNIIINVKRISEELTSNTNNSAASANQSASVLARQLSELDMLSAAINEMSCSALEVANSAQEAASSAKSAEQAADKGTAIVSQTSKSISKLVTDMDETVATVNKLEEYSDNIESVLTSITSIADQTNLLALNAAIEAARAGDMGRGFAVVADEVRALAARTQQSTKETSVIIEQLQLGVKEAVNRIEKSRVMAAKTNEEAIEADSILNDIRTSISHINDVSVNIASAAQQQSATSEEINRNTTTIRDISQEVSTEAHNQSDLCTSMVQIIEQQNSVLAKFRV